MSWVVETWSLLDGWSNTWTVDGEPQTFPVYEAAEAELEEWIEESRRAHADGERDDEYSMDEFRIVEVSDG